MARPDRKRLAVLCWPGAALGTVFSLREVLAAASIVHHSANVTVDIVSADGSAELTADGLAKIQCGPMRKRYDAAFIPPLLVRSAGEVEDRIAACGELIESVRELHRRSEMILGACSGVALLAEAGILDSREVTVCWWLEPWLKKRFPALHLKASRIVTKSNHVWTAGAGIAYMHMTLDLLSHWYGPPVASAISRLMLLDRSCGSQSPYAMPTGVRHVDDPVVQIATRRIAELVGSPLSVATLSSELGVSVRTLNRRFKAAMSMAPLAAIHQAKLARAKSLLETSDAPFDEITVECGYEDPATFHKLFSQRVGISPSAYRARFAAPRK